MLDVLGHPLLLLAVGSALSGWLLPRIAQQWQDQRKGLEIRTQLVERVVRAVTEMFTAVQFAQVGAESQTQIDFDQAYRSWQKEKAVLTSLLAAYFRNTSLDHKWIRCRALATAYYIQVGIRGRDGESAEERRRRYLSKVASGLSRPVPEDYSEDVEKELVPETAPSTSPALDLSDGTVLRLAVRRELDLTVQVMIASSVIL